MVVKSYRFFRARPYRSRRHKIMHYLEIKAQRNGSKNLNKGHQVSANHKKAGVTVLLLDKAAAKAESTTKQVLQDSWSSRHSTPLCPQGWTLLEDPTSHSRTGSFAAAAFPFSLFVCE